MTTPILSVHYSPGVLTILKQVPAGHKVPRAQSSVGLVWGVTHAPAEVIVGVPQIVTAEQAEWCLSGSHWPRQTNITAQDAIEMGF